MSTIIQSTVRNRIMAGLSAEDFALLAPHASHAVLRSGEYLSEPDRPIRDFYFPDTGMISIVTPDETEVGVVGWEGMAGLPALLGVDTAPLKVMCQIPGEGTRVPVEILLSVASATLSRTMLRYVYAFMAQLASTAQSNCAYTVEQRLARWLLMCRDRSDGDEILVTHEFMAMMLSVRRPGVTVATHVLEGNGLIRAQRGRITVRDVERLRDFANGSYGYAEAEYDRVMLEPRDIEPAAGLRVGGPSISLVS